MHRLRQKLTARLGRLRFGVAGGSSTSNAYSYGVLLTGWSYLLTSYMESVELPTKMYGLVLNYYMSLKISVSSIVRI